MNKKTLAVLLRALIVIAVTVLSAIIIYYFFKLLYPFIIGTLLVMLINPIIKFLEKKARFPRLLAVLTTLFLFITIFAGVMTLLIAEIIAGSTYLAKIVPKKVDSIINAIQLFFTDKIIPFYEGIASKFNALDSGKQDTVTRSINEASNELSSTVTSFLQNFLTSLPALVSWIPSAATTIVFILLATFFISKDWNKLSKKATSYLPEKITTHSGNVLQDLKRAGLGFVKAQFILITVTFIINLIALLIMQIEQALTISLIIAVVDLIPYLGSSAILIPWAIYEMATGSLGLGIALASLFIVVAGIRQFIEPKVLSSSLDLDPLSTLISLFVGFKLFGFLGLIIGPISLVFGMALYRTGVFQDIYRYIVRPDKNIHL